MSCWALRHTRCRLLAVPEQPANLQGAPVSPNEIRLTWDPPPDSGQSVLRYHVYYNDSHLRQNVKVTTDRPQTTYTMSDLTANTVYHIRVAAESERGEGSPTPTVQVKTDEYGEYWAIKYCTGISNKYLNLCWLAVQNHSSISRLCLVC